jgi:hypothetical protein
VLEELTECRSGALTLDGGKSSNLLTNNLSISKTEESLMFQVLKMKKEEQLLLIKLMAVTTKSGMSSMLIKPRQLQLRDLIKILDSILTVHSTLDQDSQCGELLNVLEPTMSN